MKLYELAVRRKITFIMIFLGIVGFGIVSLAQLKPELMPDITFPTVTIRQSYPGVGPVELETLITRRVEQAVSSINRVKDVSSSIREGRTTTTIEFEWGTDLEAAVADVRETLDRIQRLMPDDADSPSIFKFDFSAMPIMMIGINGPYDRVYLRELADSLIEPRIESADGVAAVSTHGGREREIQVRVERARLESLSIPVSAVIGAITSDNLSLPGGSIKTNTREYLLRTSSEFESIEDIEKLAVAQRNGSTIYIRDIAEVVDDFRERTNEMTLNGSPGVMIQVQQRSGASTVETAENVRQVLDDMTSELPSGVSFTVAMDSSEFIENSISNLVQVAIQGSILAVLILLFFLRNIPATLIVAITIPVSIIASFTAMRIGNISLNIISLGGLALAVGMLVDNAIVVLENIFRHRENGQTPIEGAIYGTAEVSMPIVASTLTTIAVFLPIFFVQGITGTIFREMVLTITLSLLVSLFAALTLIPLLSSILLTGKDIDGEIYLKSQNRLAMSISRFLHKLDSIYAKVLTWILGHKKTVIFGCLALFIFSIAAVFPLGWLPAEFMPRMDDGNISINLELPVGTRLEETIKKTNEIEKAALLQVPETDIYRSRIGPGGFGRTGPHVAQISLSLKPAAERKRSQEEITGALRQNLNSFPGVKVQVSGGGGRGLSGMTGPIEVEIFGYDLDLSRKISEEVSEIIERVPNVVNVQIGTDDPLLEYVIRMDRSRAAALGVSAASVASQVETYVLGRTIGFFRTGEDEHPITVQLKEDDRQSISQIENLPIATSTGRLLSLKTIADVVPAAGPVSIERFRQQRRNVVTADYEGKNLSAVSREIEESLSEIILPAGFYISMGGDTKEQREAFFWLGLALIGAILLVYMVMASQFESLLSPFVVLLTIPMSLIGVIWLLLFTGTSISIISLVGVIMLTGIVVNNSIILVDYINLLRARGLPLDEAVITGGKTRLRPVLMTSLTTILAMMPMAFGLGDGAEMSYPIARALIGGLVASTILTLLVIPAIYTIFTNRFSMEK